MKLNCWRIFLDLDGAIGREMDAKWDAEHGCHAGVTNESPQIIETEIDL